MSDKLSMNEILSVGNGAGEDLNVMVVKHLGENYIPPDYIEETMVVMDSWFPELYVKWAFPAPGKRTEAVHKILEISLNIAKGLVKKDNPTHFMAMSIDETMKRINKKRRRSFFEWLRNF